MPSKTLSTKKEKSLKLAKQARGTLEKVIKMIEEDKYCPEIIQQADSAVGLLRTVKKELLAGHLDTCAFDRMKENKDSAIKELLKIYNLSN
ncbi:MAG: metal-sensing transcriptional repressor [Candidatus Pacebacteria bacterium]|jgi:DNA-binding FrmR family transcriptional regulator|nr:metal-sensing transcriptional repressor [Candidatus Paceibacterota bacterium]